MAAGKEQTPRDPDDDFVEIELALRSLAPRERPAKADLNPRARLRWMLAGRATLAAGVAIPLLGHVSPGPRPTAKRSAPTLHREAIRDVPMLPSFVRDADRLAPGPRGFAGGPWSSPPDAAERPELTATGSISKAGQNAAAR
jgi:hypothetical protein